MYDVSHVMSRASLAMSDFGQFSSHVGIRKKLAIKENTNLCGTRNFAKNQESLWNRVSNEIFDLLIENLLTKLPVFNLLVHSNTNLHTLYTHGSQ